jgi:outer membrane receptor protein involved in Fe transport
MISCAVVALLGGAGGFGFSAAAAGDTPPPPPSLASGAQDGAIQEIIVSAERRDESAQKVPMTLQALSGEALDQLNVETFDDILKYTPNVTYGNNGPGQGAIFMRGLSAGFAGNQSSATVANFPNVALYLDEQSMQFPARNADVYMVDMQRVEVLEGPQGTLFGGGAEAGAVRYITNKPDLGGFSGNAEASFGGTSGGDPNASGNATLNIPIIDDKLAVRVVIYDDHRGGYIDNVASTFTRSNADLGNFYFNIRPTNGLCPNRLPAGPAGYCAIPNAPQANNFQLAGTATNPVDYEGARVSLLYQIDPDWSVLIAQSLQNMDAEGLSVEYPTGSNFQPLQPLQVTAFEPSYDKDRYENTAWTVNGKIADLNAIYTGGYMVRHISQQMEYSNYSRSVGGMYYECTGGSTGWGNGAPTCYSPAVYWDDTVKNTHLSNEFRVSTPDDWRLRAIAGAYWEQFRIDDVMNFNYKTIPACTPANLAVALSGGAPCAADVTTAPGSTATQPGMRSDSTAFGEDAQRGYDQTALFASVDYDIIPDVLTISAGTRWFDYSEFLTGSQYATVTGCLNVANGHCAGGLVNINAANDHQDYYGFRNRFGLNWHVDPDTLAYFVFSEGFRPGGFNRSVKAVAPGPDGPQYEKPNGYAPDSLTNYEIGLKTELFDHRLQFNLSAYYMTWDNVQFLFFNPTELGNTTFGVNGPDYSVKGVETQLVARLAEGLTAQGSATYNHDTQTSSPCLVDNIPGSGAFGQCITQVVQKGVGLVPFENPFGSIGSVPAFSPAWEANLRLRYDFRVEEYRAYAMVSGNYMGSMYNQPATYASGTGVTIPNTTYLRYLQPAYATADVSVGVAKNNWYGQLFCTNLFDSHASMFTSSAQFIESEVPLRPRVFGLKIGANF